MPFVVRFDAAAPAPVGPTRAWSLNIDLAPTFAELAGVELPNAEGRSLMPLLSIRRTRGGTPS